MSLPHSTGSPRFSGFAINLRFLEILCTSAIDDLYLYFPLRLRSVRCLHDVKILLVCVLIGLRAI